LTSVATALGGNDHLRTSLDRCEAKLDQLQLNINSQPAMQSDASGGSLLLELFKKVTEVSAVLGGLLYAAGWTYLYSYYKSFGVSVRELDLPLQDSLVFSFRVVFDSWATTLLCVAVVAIFALIVTNRVTERLLKTTVGIGLLLLVLFVAGYTLSKLGAAIGARHAFADLSEETSSLPTVSIAVDPTQFQPYSDEYAGFNRLEYKLLVRTKDNIFFFSPVKTSGTEAPNQVPKFILHVLPLSKVRAVRIEQSM
jgi:hypothetical protein